MAQARGSRATRLLLIGLAALAVGLQCYGLYRPSPPPVQSWFPGEDKVQHALGFGLPVFLLLLAVGRFTAAVPIVFAAQALASELVQWRWYPSRTGDPRDVLADLTGIALGVGGFVLVERRQRSRLEAPV